MLSLFKKDLLCVRSYLLKQYGIMVLVFTVFSLYMKNTAMLVGVLGMVSYVAASSCFSFDDANGFNRFARTLPVNTNQIVGARYLMIIAGFGLGFFISITLGSAISFIIKFPFIEHLSTCLSVFLLFLFTASINTPIIMKFGIEKSRLMMNFSYIIPFFLAMGGIALINAFNIPMPEWLKNASTNFSFIILLLSAIATLIILLFIGSYFLSVKIMKNKEL